MGERGGRVCARQWIWVVVAFCLWSVAVQVTGASHAEEGSIMLTGGRDEYEGTVLIYHMGLWGAVCDKAWDRNDAHVVCRQLGFVGEKQASKRSRFGQGAAWMWMSRVRCYGNEKRLDMCRFDGWGRSNCYGGRNSAGVKCMRPATIAPPRTTTKRPAKTPGPDVLLADEPLDVPENETNQITDETNHVEGVAEETTEDPTAVGTTYTTLVVETTTRRSRLSAWRRQRRRKFLRRRRRTTTAAPILDREMADETGPPLRLGGGRFAEEGRVEVRVPGRRGWMAVCGDTWTITEGMVVCRQLGMGYAKIVTATSFYGGDRMDKIYKHVRCRGNETQLSNCVIHLKENGVACNFSSSIAGVMCTKTLPDLVPNVTVLEDSAHLRDHHLYYLQCAMEENCLASTAYALRKKHNDWIQSVRRLMRFSSVIHNRGTDDFRPIVPKERWDWHECHMHYHSMEVFANYDITDQHGNKVAEGHKASFCLEDSQCDPGKEKKFQCKGFADQGISVNCSDNYLAEIDCQWIDITDLSPGTYTFRVLVNPEKRVAELNFDNNLVSCDMFYSLYKFKVENCTLGPEPLSRLE